MTTGQGCCGSRLVQVLQDGDIAANNLPKMNLKHLPFKYYFLYTKNIEHCFPKFNIRQSEDPLTNTMVRLHQCSHCDYKASQKGNLQRHIESIHESLKFSCILCSAQFSMKASLLCPYQEGCMALTTESHQVPRNPCHPS